MAGNYQGDLSGNIFTDAAYNNIVLVDPNKTVDVNGVVSERLVDHENLVMYANLEAQILPRTKLVLGLQPDDSVNTSMTIAKMNFLKPTKDNFISAGYYDELTGKGTLTSQGKNQMQEQQKTDPQGRAYFKQGVVDENNVEDNALLGITSINVQVGASFIPSVTMQLEDIQGRALFQLGDQSPYAAFFNLPYPQFYLTLKGYYGQAIRYQLNLEKFDARFNTTTGNYSVTLEFKGFKFNVLNEILVSHLIALPHMYNKRFGVSFDPAVANNSSNNSNLVAQTSAAQTGKVNTDPSSKTSVYGEYVTELGYQKIVEVYQEYKNKKLIPTDFPELTLMQLVNKLDMFEKNIIDSYPQVNVEPLTNIKNYKVFLTGYYEQVAATKYGGWLFDNCELTPIVLENGQKIYYLKKAIRNTPQSTIDAETILNSIIENNNKTLLENPTLGQGRPDYIPLNNLSYQQLTAQPFTLQNVNKEKTAALKYNVPVATQEQIDKTVEEINSLLTWETAAAENKTTKFKITTFFTFDEFTKTVKRIDSDATKKLSAYEQVITNELRQLVVDSTTGVGFNPTARNISAVIMASAEAFLRLMEEVHKNAWNVKYDDTRKLIIQNTNKSGKNTEASQVVQISSQANNDNQGLVNGQIPVYPWPQFYTESPDEKAGKFQLTYVGDQRIAELTKAYDFKIWPEVEFVEEYIKGLVLKDNPPIQQSPLDSDATTFLINVNAIEYPPTNLPYLNKEEIKFFYEIWERQFVTSHYSNYNRALFNQVQQIQDLNRDAETNNIITSLGNSNPFISFKLKNTAGLTAADYSTFLKTISNGGTGELYQRYIRDFFVTPYIADETENAFKIFKTTQTGLEPQQHTVSTPLSQLLTNANNTPFIVDTYPFRDYNWVKTGMAQSINSEGENVYSTNAVLKVYNDRNVIANFTNMYDYNTNRPVTNFSYLNFTTPDIAKSTNAISTQTLTDFYNSRKTETFITTEGYIKNSLSQILPKTTTTSILNSPYFINAIQNGVSLQKNSNKYPYVQAAYLFLNSLPLISLRERYKTYENNATKDLDYIASCFNKFGAIHKLPYTWILKLGSVWHRYKTYVETQSDILDGIWKDFDYVKNYDPVLSSSTTKYKLTIPGTGYREIQLETNNNGNINIQCGFYPKLMNDFAYFYNGQDLFKNYTDAEIQSAINDGLLLYQFDKSGFNLTEGNKSLNLSTWSAIIPNTVQNAYQTPNNCVPVITPTGATEYFILPSFGINMNQAGIELANNTISSVSGSTALFNGTVRSLWAAPNYGYFDNGPIVKPSYKSYMNIVYSSIQTIAPMTLLDSDEYTKIEEIFGVFDRKTLDIIEQEFLNYCTPSSNVQYGYIKSELGVSGVQLDAISRNFQTFMKEAMTLTPSVGPTNSSSFFQNAINLQLSNFKTQIKSIMEYDVIVRNGNPSKYGRRIFDSFVSLRQTNPTVTDPITFNQYVVNSLPSSNGGVTLQQSINAYTNEWKSLETEVGYSTIPGLEYSNNGSYITDFFIDFDIEFSVRNIQLCSQLIKMYATQKLINGTTASQFRSNLSQYLTNNNTLQTNLLQAVLTYTKQKLPEIKPPQDQTIQSAVTGLQGKVEIYNVFKAVNDKWISGTDYDKKTLFEDILFLDRASRNIGDTIVIDIFAIKNMLSKNALNENMSVYTLLSGLLMQNNFTVMPLPAFSNFYNVMNVDGINTPNAENVQDFANNFWGTFTAVDYSRATPKMVCFYVGKPSDQLAVPSIKGYSDDGFDLRVAAGSPLIEDQNGKTDWNLSNKCVGFNVDIGIRNQNVFQNFSVSQDTGKATSEAITQVITMADQKNTRNVATQNASLYNLYKRRSYKCEVTAMGNAMIQPVMYFNLRHVPMFNGPYLITDINHIITPGDFTTNFTGVRQGIYDMPPIDNFIQRINQNLLSQLENKVNEKTSQNTTITTTNQGDADNIIENSEALTKAAENSCSANLNPQFARYIPLTPVATAVTASDFANILKTNSLTASKPELQTIIYVLSYLRTFVPRGKSTGMFNAFDSNLGNITLDKPISGPNRNFVPNAYSCINTPTSDGKISPYPAARFESIDKYVQFMQELVGPRVNQIIQQQQLIQYYCTAFPSSNVSVDYFTQNEQKFLDEFIPLFKQALDSAHAQGLFTDFKIKPENQSGNQGVTTPSAPTCPATTITTLNPSDGTTGTIVSMSGTNLEYVRQIEIGNGLTWTTVDSRSVQFISTTKIKFSIPSIPSITTPTNLQIRVTTSGSLTPILAPVTFTFNPN